MNKALGLTTLLIFISLMCNAQGYSTFYKQMHLADSLAVTKDVDSSLVVLENAFRSVDFVNTIFLKKALQIAKQKHDEVRIQQYTDQIERQLKGTNLELRKIIDSLGVEDQRVRDKRHSRALKKYSKNLIDSSSHKQSPKLSKAKILITDWNKTDSSNINYLLMLFDQYGFIGEELVGASYTKIIAILIHYDDDRENRILKPILAKARRNGKILPLHAAQIMDRHYLNANNAQIYWTWPYASHIVLLFDEKDVNRILEMREDIWIYGSELSQEYKRGYWILRNHFEY